MNTKTQDNTKALRQFVQDFAHFTPYRWDTDEGWKDEQGGDAIEVANRMIAKARALLGMTPIPAREIGDCADVRDPGEGGAA